MSSPKTLSRVLLANIADDGQSALECLQKERFDVVLMDVQMPLMDGYEATLHIRSDAIHDRLPIIAMTAHAMVKDGERCLQVGMNDYASTPFDPEELLCIVAKWGSYGEQEK